MKVIRDKAIFNVQAKKSIFIDSLFKRPQSLSELLPYDEYLPETGMFRMKDGSLGAVFELRLLEHEALTTEQILDAVSSLKAWFSLPNECVLQILYDQSYRSPLDSLFNQDSFPNGNPVSKALFSDRLQTIKNSCKNGSKDRPLTRRCYVSLRYYPLSLKGKRQVALPKRSEATLYREMKSFIRESKNFAQIVAGFKQNSHLNLRPLAADDLLDVLRRFFNPETYYKRSFATYNPNHPIADQILYNAPKLSFSGIEREGGKTRTLSLKTSPFEAYPGGMAYFTKLNFPFKLALNFKFPTKRQTKNFLDLKEFFLQNTPSAKARRQREEVLAVQERLARDDRCIHMTFNVIVEGTSDDELDQRVREVVHVFNNELECETIVEDDIGLGLCLNTLPLSYSPQADASSQRYIRILRSDAINFLPIFDSFRGLKSPLQLYISRENNLVPFSLLENETSNHTVVIADSGSGKSAFVINCVLSAKRLDPEPLLFVIDKKSSHVMASEYFDGDLNIFQREKGIFSPFRGLYDEDKFAFLTSLFTSGIRMTSPNFNFESIHSAAITKALKLAYRKKVQQAGLAYVDGELLKQGQDSHIELTMDDFIAELSRLPSEKEFENCADSIQELLKYLMPFYGEGMYANYFRGQGQKPRKSALYYIYDLDALDSDSTLQSLMTMAVTEEIRQIMKLPENEGREAFIIFEEIGMLGRKNPTVSDFIVDFAETARKLGIWLISLTPRPQNYVELEAGKAMWGVADNFIFLQMSADNVNYLGKHSELLDEANREIIKSLKTKRGHYAEVFYMNKKKTRQGAFRYHQTPLERWLAPTNAKDAREATRALKKFKDEKWKALEYLSEKYPHGVEAEVK